MKRPVTVGILIFWIAFLGLGGIYGGLTMLLDPSGDLLQMAEILPMLPVSDFILPGLFLFFVMGLFPLLLIYGIIARPNWSRPAPVLQKFRFHWVWTGILLLVIFLVLWLVLEGMLIGFKWGIQFVTAFDGLFIIIFTFLPSVRNYFRK